MDSSAEALSAAPRAPRLIVSFATGTGPQGPGGGHGFGVDYNPAIPLRKNAESFASTVWDSAFPEPTVAAFATMTLYGSEHLDLDRIAAFVRVENVEGPIAVRAQAEDNAGLLGRLAPTPVDDPAGVLAILNGARVTSSRTDIRDATLRWQVRLGEEGGEWEDVGVQRVRLYTVPRPPTDPWLGEPWPWAPRDGGVSSPYCVWTDVLDWTCRWARGADDQDEAAGRITRAIYDLGREGAPGRLTYGDDGRKYGRVAGLDPARNEMTVESFALTAFLRRLAGEESRGAILNCFDCAGAVVVFGASVGCPLRKVSFSQLDEGAFRLHPMRVIGEVPSDAPKIGGFFHGHVVAWTGPLDERGRIFDACTAFADGAGGHASSTGLVWGEPGEAGSYRVRLSPDEAELRVNREYRPLLLVPPKLLFDLDGD